VAVAIFLVSDVVPAVDARAMDFTWLFVKMLLVLGIVTVIAILFLKYVMPRIGSVSRFRQGGYFQVLAKCPLDMRKSVFLIKVGGKYLVVGVSEHNISLLTELESADWEHDGGEKTG